MNHKENNLFKIIKVIAPKCWNAAPLLWIAVLFTDVISSIVAVVMVYLQQKLYDTINSVVSGNKNIKIVFIALAFLIIVKLIDSILNAASTYLPDVFFNKVSGKLSFELHEKISKLEPINFENTKILDDINKATLGSNNAIYFMCRFGYIFTFYGTYIISMTVYLFKLNKILAFVMLIIFIPNIISQVIRMKTFKDAEEEAAPIRRKYDYYEQCLVSREYYKETRLLGIFGYFKRLYLEALDNLQKIKYKAQYRTAWFDFIISIITILGYIGVIYMLFTSLMDGFITVGAFAAIYGSLGDMYDMMESMMQYSIGGMAQDYGTINNYLNFLKLPEQNGKKLVFEGDIDITLENVSFAYPNVCESAETVANKTVSNNLCNNLHKSNIPNTATENIQKKKYVVKNATLHIKKGETLAIVGENGSGKSTIIRLITGLYKPDEGIIKYNGKDISKYKLNDISSASSAVFQKYQRYQDTLANNISISKKEKAFNKDEVDKICNESGVNILSSDYPDGYDTMLSKEFGGVDISGGQWQRVAIARAFFREHQLIVLDEPTSAIDPYEETRIYNKFAQISKDKTAIIVTHRLGSTKLADRIVVMKNGYIAEVGTHNELIKNNCEYARLYKAQEEWYQEDKT
ncbi:MAG: ABC transporter ATP-binding protein [Lachnospiraceae bacterium]|nr:ABC transporter ATP-binding protein [Lachnospiraceae bacterium]